MNNPIIEEPKVVPREKPTTKPIPNRDPWKLPNNIPFPKIKPKA